MDFFQRQGWRLAAEHSVVLGEQPAGGSRYWRKRSLRSKKVVKKNEPPPLPPVRLAHECKCAFRMQREWRGHTLFGATKLGVARIADRLARRA